MPFATIFTLTTRSQALYTQTHWALARVLTQAHRLTSSWTHTHQTRSLIQLCTVLHIHTRTLSHLHSFRFTHTHFPLAIILVHTPTTRYVYLQAPLCMHTLSPTHSYVHPHWPKHSSLFTPNHTRIHNPISAILRSRPRAHTRSQPPHALTQACELSHMLPVVRTQAQSISHPAILMHTLAFTITFSHVVTSLQSCHAVGPK